MVPRLFILGHVQIFWTLSNNRMYFVKRWGGGWLFRFFRLGIHVHRWTYGMGMTHFCDRNEKARICLHR